MTSAKLMKFGPFSPLSATNATYYYCFSHKKYAVHVHRERAALFPSHIHPSGGRVAAIPFNFHLSIQRTATTISHGERGAPFKGRMNCGRIQKRENRKFPYVMTYSSSIQKETFLLKSVRNGRYDDDECWLQATMRWLLTYIKQCSNEAGS